MGSREQFGTNCEDKTTIEAATGQCLLRKELEYF